jgi:hypothetical protein
MKSVLPSRHASLRTVRERLDHLGLSFRDVRHDLGCHQGVRSTAQLTNAELRELLRLLGDWIEEQAIEDVWEVCP